MEKLSVVDPDQVKARIEVLIWFCYLHIFKSDHNGKVSLVFSSENHPQMLNKEDSMFMQRG